MKSTLVQLRDISMKFTKTRGTMVQVQILINEKFNTKLNFSKTIFIQTTVTVLMQSELPAFICHKIHLFQLERQVNYLNFSSGIKQGT